MSAIQVMNSGQLKYYTVISKTFLPGRLMMNTGLSQ